MDLHKLSPAEFPKALGEIPTPPKQLFLQGNLPDPNKNHYLTVVGSRRFSNYGREVCEKLISGLAGFPIIIVSGLAIGIDTIAHKTAMKVGLVTVAVPGSGLLPDVLYPRSNVNLAHEIVSAGGALLSEFDPDTKAAKYTFPQRNRIMAGISEATLIIEATEKSGTLITARLALDYNREVLAVPGSISSLGSQGTNRLIKSGATPIMSSDDILEIFGLENKSEEKTNEFLENLNTEEKIICKLLTIEPLVRDQIITKAKLGTSETNMILSRLEVKGIIKESGGYFILS